MTLCDNIPFPGESRGPCDAALRLLGPGFRRGTPIFLTEMVADLIQAAQ